MSKRNFILLIIILAIIIFGVLGFLFFSSNSTTTGGGIGTNFISRFNPFGNGGTSKPATTTPPVDVSGYVPPITTPVAPVKLNKVSSMPIAGYTVFSKERLKDVPIPPATTDTTTQTPPATTTTPIKVAVKTKVVPPATEFAPALRYVAKATGNIFETFVDKIDEKQFSNTVIPQVYDAYFGNQGQSVAMRHLKDDGETIETFVGNLPKEVLGADQNTINEIKGAFLPDNVKDISISPDTSKMFYLFYSNDSMTGMTLNFADNKKTQIINSPFTEWLSVWPTTNLITLSTKPSSTMPGYMYNTDPTKKTLTKTLGGINGLTTLTGPNGKMVLYGDNTLSLNIYHSDTGVTNTLGIKTLPEKCVWNKAGDTIYCAVPKSIGTGEYPDTWYQGEVSFNDQIWKVDVKSNTATLLLDPITVTGGVEIDGIKLMLDSSENYLFFVNKKDSYLWEFNLK